MKPTARVLSIPSTLTVARLVTGRLAKLVEAGYGQKIKGTGDREGEITGKLTWIIHNPNEGTSH
jgi:hypothetical protein